MPKEVLRSGAPAQTAAPAAKPAAPAAAAVPPAPVAVIDPHANALEEMEKRLKAMNLEPGLITAALAAERAKLSKTAAPAAKAATPAPAAKAAAPAAAAPKAAAPAPAKAPPAPVEKAAPAEEQPSDEEFAAQAAAAYEAGGSEEELPPEEAQQLPATQETPGAADHGEDDGVPPGGMVVQNHWSQASEGAITGPIDRTDFKTPQLKIVQGSGPLSKLFNQGTLIYMDQTIFEPPAPDKPGPAIKFIPVKLEKYYRESLQRDPNAPAGQEQRQPRNAATPEEVYRLGGTLEFKVVGDKRIKPTWAPAARCLVIIERPEGCTHPGFGLEMEIGGVTRAYAPAVMYVNGGQYRAFFKPIMDATSFILCEGTGKDRKIVLEKRVWKMQVAKEESGENMVFNPKIAMIDEATPPDLREYAKSLRG